jgi:succinoglycan biosynthesis transport protein ExoP
MLAGSLGGFAIGFAIGILRDSADKVFRTTRQIETALQVDCIALVPYQRPSSIRRRRFKSGSNLPQVATMRRDDLMRHALESPFSHYAEAIRAIKLDLDAACAFKPSKVFGFTSAVANEGKSTIAFSVGLVAASAGARVILIDCDFRNPSLGKRLKLHTQVGLLDVISGEVSLDQAVLKDPSTNLAVLPSLPTRRPEWSNEIVSSEKAKKLFELLRTMYDYIIVDLPPLAPITDARATTDLIDAYVVVVEWGRTRIEVVESSLREARSVYQKVSGIVLNKTVMEGLGQYGEPRRFYYGG